MIQKLNKLEISILERLSIEYSFINEHLPFLKVNNRETTGVGMYVNFIYDIPDNKELHIGVENSIISTNETIDFDGLEYGLGYEIYITKGKIKYIEMVTHGEEWDGNIPDNFTFTK